MAAKMIRVAVVTVSDSSSAGTREDASGPAVAGRCEALGWIVQRREVVADDQTRIARLLVELAASGECDVVLTTGGTGVALRDVTPEATRAIIDKEIPGLAEIMRSNGLKHTRRAALSRGIAGSRGATLIVNLPGSPKGAVQSLDSISDLVGHVADLLHGFTGHAPSV
jgi:molybdenum cofactor synthesis domain-containing protein